MFIGSGATHLFNYVLGYARKDAGQVNTEDSFVAGN